MMKVHDSARSMASESWVAIHDPALSAYIPFLVGRPSSTPRAAPERTAVSEWDDVVCADFGWHARRLVRDAAADGAADDSYFAISLVHAGSAQVKAGAMACAVSTGDLFMWDSRCKTEMAVPSSLDMSTVLVPSSVLTRASSVTLPLTLQHLGDSPAAPMLAHLLHTVREIPGTPSCARRLRNAMVEGVLAALEPVETAESASLLPHLRRTVRAYIEQRLDDPDLNPGSIARAHAVSVRTLSRAFEGEHPTVAQLIRFGRLELARDFLTRPDLSITSISERLHFANPSHFARVFSDTFGVTPREYRDRRLQNSRLIKRSVLAV